MVGLSTKEVTYQQLNYFRAAGITEYKLKGIPL